MGRMPCVILAAGGFSVNAAVNDGALLQSRDDLRRAFTRPSRPGYHRPGFQPDGGGAPGLFALGPAAGRSFGGGESAGSGGETRAASRRRRATRMAASPPSRTA